MSGAITGTAGADRLTGTAGADLILGFDPMAATAALTGIEAVRVATGLSRPLFATAPPDDPARLFIVEQGGRILLLDLAGNRLAPAPFLDLSGQVAAQGEQGLIGFAFHPQFATNGRFYVHLSNLAGDSEVREYSVSGTDPGHADPASGRLILRINQPDGLTNHKGGWLGFGPDGYLRIATGDGGGGGDPSGNGQNIDALLGKILRIDVNGDAYPGDPARNYAIPADNPFAAGGGAPEVWAHGLRNPWRPSFDSATGEFWIADVGQGRWEEINLGTAGANYGWNLFEGPEAFISGASPTGLTPPLHFYGRDLGSSITGGYAYRGPEDALFGAYVFADFVSGRLLTLQRDPVTGAPIVSDRTAQLAHDVGRLDNPSSFGEDASGNLYIVDYDGDVFRLTPRGSTADAGDHLSGGAGNDVIFAGAGADLVLGGDGADRLWGMAGDDILQGDAGSDLIHGGSGYDTAVFAGARSDYAISFAPGGVLDVTGIRSAAQAGGTDRLVQVEVLRFADTAISTADLLAGRPAPPEDGNPLFDAGFYLALNPDVAAAGVDPRAHFDSSGWREGRDPNTLFDSGAYLAANPDVRRAGINPLDHYMISGWREGRDPSAQFDIERYLAANPDVRAAGIEPLSHYLALGASEGRSRFDAIGAIDGGVDRLFYVVTYRDVALAGIDPADHFRQSGWREGRNPNGLFDTAGYLAANPDVAAAGTDPLLHYLTSGWRDGRDPSPAFDTTSYLAAYPDIAAAGGNPLMHYLSHGAAEGRQTFGDGDWM